MEEDNLETNSSVIHAVHEQRIYDAEVETQNTNLRLDLLSLRFDSLGEIRRQRLWGHDNVPQPVQNFFSLNLFLPTLFSLYLHGAVKLLFVLAIFIAVFSIYFCVACSLFFLFYTPLAIFYQYFMYMPGGEMEEIILPFVGAYEVEGSLLKILWLALGLLQSILSCLDFGAAACALILILEMAKSTTKMEIAFRMNFKYFEYEVISSVMISLVVYLLGGYYMMDVLPEKAPEYIPDVLVRVQFFLYVWVKRLFCNILLVVGSGMERDGLAQLYFSNSGVLNSLLSVLGVTIGIHLIRELRKGGQKRIIV